ncbi:MAG TPA: DUF2752 domain-containing protein [Methylomirabilota bacterium]|nr:DUF2752 domain-containing protein [Methylomirabilota bacterium]
MTPAQSIPPKISRQPSLGFFAAAIFGTAILGTGAMIFFFNPSTHKFYPICLFHAVTGLNCPGCGATRSFYALLHGHFQLALKDNALFVFTLAAAAIRGAWFAQRKILRKPTGQFISPKMLWLLLIIGGIFAALRNLPAFAFLSP